MKPRIRIAHGIWYCGMPIAPLWGGGNRVWIGVPWGHGYTPKEAYEDWTRQA